MITDYRTILVVIVMRKKWGEWWVVLFFFLVFGFSRCKISTYATDRRLFSKEWLLDFSQTISWSIHLLVKLQTCFRDLKIAWVWTCVQVWILCLLQTFLPSGIYERQQRGNPITKHKLHVFIRNTTRFSVKKFKVLDERTAIWDCVQYIITRDKRIPKTLHVQPQLKQLCTMQRNCTNCKQKETEMQ